MIVNYAGEGIFPLRKNIVEWQVGTLLSLCRSKIYYDKMHSIDRNWLEQCISTCIIQINNMSFLHFLVEWCKVFGQNNNEIHWKKALLESRTTSNKPVCTQERFERKVRSVICEHAEITVNEFSRIHSAITHARSTYAVHINPGEMQALPGLDTAYNIANAYTSFLGHAQDHYIPLLETYELGFEQEVVSFLNHQFAME